MPSTELSPELSSLRRRYSDAALAAIPKLLILVDRNPYSPTYGCFDRAYWHYRTMDFPCGMSQEFGLPLALAYAGDYPDNKYAGVERVKELSLAAIDFAAKSSHPDGSCDDYFPYEQALGALVFSLYAMSETCLVLKEEKASHLEFLARRGEWLLRNNESGQLANHQAFAALALQNVYQLTGDKRFADGRDHYLDIVESWQSDEGWFQEYEGADPGYHSCSIAFLGKLMKKVEGQPAGDRILKMLDPAVDFAWHFMHPDGSYAGEYGSRNTYHFYPHGFEIMAPHNEKAGQIADQFLKKGLPDGRRYFNDDDRMLAHYVYDWFQSYQDFHADRPEPINARSDFQTHFPQAQMVVKKTPSYYAVANISKGGVLKVTTEAGPIYSDTGLIARTENGDVLVSHLVADYDTKVDLSNAGIEAEVSGYLHHRRTKLPTPFKQVLFRILNLTFGRFAPDLLRSILQKILITGKPESEYRFLRELSFSDDGITIENTITLQPRMARLTSLHVGSDATSIYVANSNVYQESVLLPWTDYSEHLKQLETGDQVKFTIKVPLNS